MAQASEVRPASEVAPVEVSPPVPAKAAARASKHYKLADRATRSQDTIVRVGDLLIGGDGFVVMAGPCSVESAEMIQKTALYVRDKGAHMLRGGVFNQGEPVQEPAQAKGGTVLQGNLDGLKVTGGQG